MKDLIINACAQKLITMIKNFNTKSVMIVFLGNSKIFYDNFSSVVISVLNKNKSKLKSKNMKFYFCYARFGIYGKNYFKMLSNVERFSGGIIFIDSGFCDKNDELGLLKIKHGFTKSVASINTFKDKCCFENDIYNDICERKDIISVLFNCACFKDCVFVNEKLKNGIAKILAQILMKVISESY